MKNTNLTAIIAAVTTIEILFDDTIAVQYNLFEHAQPKNMTFNSFHSLLDYTKFLKQKHVEFKKEFDRYIGANHDVNVVIQMIEEWCNRYYHSPLKGSDLVLHDHIFLAAESQHKDQIDDIKLKVSGFLSAQKKNIV